MTPSGTDLRRMLANARETKEKAIRLMEFRDAAGELKGFDADAEKNLRLGWAEGVEATLAWILGERKEPPL